MFVVGKKYIGMWPGLPEVKGNGLGGSLDKHNQTEVPVWGLPALFSKWGHGSRILNVWTCRSWECSWVLGAEGASLLGRLFLEAPKSYWARASVWLVQASCLVAFWGQRWLLWSKRGSRKSWATGDWLTTKSKVFKNAAYSSVKLQRGHTRITLDTWLLDASLSHLAQEWRAKASVTVGLGWKQ